MKIKINFVIYFYRFFSDRHFSVLLWNNERCLIFIVNIPTDLCCDNTDQFFLFVILIANSYKIFNKQKTLKLMKQKQSKTVYTPNESFECKRPLGWDEISRCLTVAINRYNRMEQKRWKNSSFFVRLFTRPAKYKVETRAVADPEMMKVYQETHHHRIWIENTRKKKMCFNLLCKTDSLRSSMFLQDGVKYKDFLLISEETSVRWTEKKFTFLYEIIQFIDYEVS